MTRKFLHVGCGPKTRNQTTKGFYLGDWEEVRFDIDPSVKPDLIGTMTDMSSVQTGSVDAVFSSHNIEHLFPHEVPTALREFARVLNENGFVVITCPDLQSVCKLIADDLLTEPAYVSPAGPIAPLDILYGHRPSLQRGNHYMAHKCGFTQKLLIGCLREAGFTKVASFSRGYHPFFDLWAVAAKGEISDSEILDIAKQHIP